jgi:hypothetical protein
MATLLTLLFTFPRSTSPGSESGSRSLASTTGMHNPPGRSDLSLLASDKHVLPVARRPPPHLRLRRCSHASPHKTKMGGATAKRTQKRQYSGTTVSTTTNHQVPIGRPNFQ